MLRGKKWKNLRFFMWEGVVYEGNNFELAEEMTKTFSNSGVTECLMHARRSSSLYNRVLTLPSQYGINALRVIPDMGLSFNEKEVLKKNPEIIRITKSNKKTRGLNFRNICPVAFRDDKALRKDLANGLEKYIKIRKGVLKGLVIDVEFREKHFTCYCPKCISEFQKEYAIPQKLNSDIINSKFKKQWIEFSCKMISEKILIVNNIIKSVDENIKLYIYSAYQRKRIKDCHGTDWKLWAPNIDIASCGYGRQRENAINT
jgi:translation initiation factor 2 beta subunit (eIF-2beta)/eIF-5